MKRLILRRVLKEPAPLQSVATDTAPFPCVCWFEDLHLGMTFMLHSSQINATFTKTDVDHASTATNRVMFTGRNNVRISTHDFELIRQSLPAHQFTGTANFGGTPVAVEPSEVPPSPRNYDQFVQMTFSSVRIGQRFWLMQREHRTPEHMLKVTSFRAAFVSSGSSVALRDADRVLIRRSAA